MMTPDTPEKMVVLGKVSSVYGVKGWLKIYSYTEPMDRILEYTEWMLNLNGRWTPVEIDKGRSHGKGMVAHIAGCDDRDQARQYCGAEIGVPEEELPELPDGEYYWYELEGLAVETTAGIKLGKVDHLMSAGASNDVLVVKGDADSFDRQQRLIPYVPDVYVQDIDLEAGRILVEWDPEF
ncbi:ribosome maturation factor RimM [Saccharospirillum mangrovi]|uniref:ribosome maturation factor RimM n=2 Tax=Saccharospirillum mangrovi TaxID=2161747 RepID=UPI000D3A4121